MKKNQILYWISTGSIIAVMLFSIYKMYTPDYDLLNLPYYLRNELAIAKLIGVAVLLIPGLPIWMKEWAYAGFAITLVSATVAHYNSGDGLLRSLEPLLFLVVLAISKIYSDKLNKPV